MWIRAGLCARKPRVLRSEKPVMPDAEPPSAVSKYQPNKSRAGWALCLSGGGFRAALFHLGTLRRLNELGILSQVSTITSVSGGSIISAHLATRWKWPAPDTSALNWDVFVAAPFCAFTSRDLRTGATRRPSVLTRQTAFVAGMMGPSFRTLFARAAVQVPARTMEGAREPACYG